MLNVGYVCTPYLHNRDSTELKTLWMHSRNILSLHFATATFSEDTKPYFSLRPNHYLVAKYRDEEKIRKDIERFGQTSTLVFSIEEDLFQRELFDDVNFVSIYYLKYSESDEDIGEVAAQLAKRSQVGKAALGRMNTYSTTPSKFTFPYGDNVVVLEVASEKSHQSVKKYCEKTRRDVCQKGIEMSNLFALSLLEQLK
jgi:hypothetical protein